MCAVSVSMIGRMEPPMTPGLNAINKAFLLIEVCGKVRTVCGAYGRLTRGSAFMRSRRAQLCNSAPTEGRSFVFFVASPFRLRHVVRKTRIYRFTLTCLLRATGFDDHSRKSP